MSETDEAGGQTQAATLQKSEAQSEQETDEEALIRILKNPEMECLLKTLAQSL